MSKVESFVVEIKSKFDAEFRRFSINRSQQPKFDNLKQILETLHHLQGTPFVVQYTDPKDNDLLPINNDDNFLHALNVCRHILRILLQRKGESYGEINGYGSSRPKKSALSRLTGSGTIPAKLGPQIIMKDDFRRVSSIIDVDIVPETLRRVKLMKSGVRPLGFYIRDGTSIRVSPSGIEKVPSIFISRLLEGGLAESTGLLAVNDEVIEVNGIEVSGKSLDQVTDMMVANSSNLIITVKPVNQSTCLPPRRSGAASLPNVDSLRSSGGMLQGKRSSQVSNHSLRSQDSNGSREEGDEVREFSVAHTGSGKGRASNSRDLVRTTPEEEDDGIVTL